MTESLTKLSMYTRYVKDDKYSFFINFLYGETSKYKEQIKSLNFRYNKFSREYFRVFIDEQKEIEFISQVFNKFDSISYYPFLKKRIEQTIESLDKIIRDKYKMTLARIEARFCNTNESVNLFVLLKYFHFYIKNRCFMPLPQKFPSRIVLDGETNKELLSFDEFLQYKPVLITNDGRLYLFLQVLSDYFKNVYVITATAKDLSSFVQNNYIILLENVPQFFISSINDKSKFFIFVTPLQ